MTCLLSTKILVSDNNLVGCFCEIRTDSTELMMEKTGCEFIVKLYLFY